MRSRALTHWIAALFVLAHVLAPGFHALQLRVEQQRGEVVRLCCMAGNRLGGGDPSTPTRAELHGARLLHCAIGTLLLTGHDYLPCLAHTVPTPPARGIASAHLERHCERDRRPGTPPARAPPREPSAPTVPSFLIQATAG